MHSLLKSTYTLIHCLLVFLEQTHQRFSVQRAPSFSNHWLQILYLVLSGFGVDPVGDGVVLTLLSGLPTKD